MAVISSLVVALVVSLVVVISSIVGYYYATGVLPGAKLIQQTPPISNSQTISEGQAKMMFFHASWCPHCKTASTEWTSFKQLVSNSNYTYGYNKIIFEEIPDTNKGKVALYKVKAFPTFKVETKDKLFEMQAVPTVRSFRDFLITALGAEKGT